MDQNRNKAIFSLIYQLHISDDRVETKELLFMRDLAEQLQLDSAALDEISNDPKAYELAPPPDERERMEILYYLLFAMRIDGEINTTEEAFVYKLGLKLGFNDQMVAELIGVMKQHLHTRLPKDALVKVIQKHLN